jgi:hypothetical protein
MSKAFGAVVDAKIAAGQLGNRAELTLQAILAYNKKQVVSNVRVEGDERAAIKFLSACNTEFIELLRQTWNEYKVKESPVVTNLLANAWLVAPPSGFGPRWTTFMTASPAKFVVWLRRLVQAFKARVDRAKQESKAPSLRTRAATPP